MNNLITFSLILAGMLLLLLRKGTKRQRRAN
ncbi:DNA/RNA endonuclease, partial [Lacticaseibacillus paracasei]